MSDVRDIPIANLLIDVTNPRYDTEQEDQKAALRALAEEQGEKLLNLAGDIVNYGLDPSSLAIVIEASREPTRYIVVEGNRRLAALKLLENPGLVKGAWQSRSERRLQTLSEGFWAAPITEVPCVVAPDREAASHWIVLRHRGEQHGRGIVAWDGFAAARFEARSGGGRYDAALQAVDLVRERGDLGEATLEGLAAIPITTVQRLLNDPAARSVLGVELEDGQLTTRLPEKEVLKGLTRILRDAARGKLPVSKVETKEDRAAYLRTFKAQELPAANAIVGPSRPLSALPSASTPRRKRVVEPSKKRPMLIPRTCVLRISERKPNDIYHELRRLRLDSFPHAVSVLFRVFFELSVDHYITTHKLMTKAVLDAAKLRSKVVQVADHLERTNVMTKRELTGVRRVADPQHFLASSINTLHAYVHDANLTPGPGDLRAAWDGLEHLLVKVWE